MAFESLTLAAAAAIHLSAVDTGSKPFSQTGAGTAEAIIFVVLALGAFALHRGRPRCHRAALAATAFAIVGFVVGLSFTLRGGAPGDIAYHATMLPLLIFTALLLVRGGRTSRRRLGAAR